MITPIRNLIRIKELHCEYKCNSYSCPMEGFCCCCCCFYDGQSDGFKFESQSYWSNDLMIS